jgi:RsmE family RNA methyltransferase
VNLLLLSDDDRSGAASFRISGDRARHVRDVLGATVGDTLRAGLLEGPVGEARVTALGTEEIEVSARLTGDPPPRADVDLVLAIPRPKMLRRLLPQLAALGVDRLILLRTWRVEKPYLTARILRPEVYRPLLHEGMSQARTTREPRVTVEPLFRPFVEDRAAELFTGSRRLVGHPLAPHPFAEVRLAHAEKVALVIGPEGGLLPFEIELLGAAGFEGVSLGARTLRVDTAAVAMVAGVGLLRARALHR